MIRILQLFIYCLIAFNIQGQGRILGEIRDASNNEPIEFATILIIQTGTGGLSDTDGSFELTNVTPGIYDLQVSFLGYKEKTFYEVEVTSSKPTYLEVSLEESATSLEEVVVKASPFKKTEESPVSLRNIGITEIKRNPGGNRDISLVVQTLPGVASTASFRNDLIIRGGAPNENRFYLDDVEVPNINHFATQGASGGPTGLINVDFIREVDFYSGAFPSNRGNALSSVFNFKQKDGRKDRIGATATLGASDFGISLEGPIGENTTFIASARRSYLQFLFSLLELPFLPIYNDFQAKVKYRKGKNEIYFLGLGAIDQFQLNLEANETEAQQFLLNNLPVSPQWNYTNGLVYKRYFEKGYSTFVISRNMLNNQSFKYQDNDDSSEDNKILDYLSQEIENKFRFEHNVRFGKVKLNFGVNYEFAKFYANTFAKQFIPGVGLAEINSESALDFHKYGAFAQYSQNFLNDRLIFSLGARIDGNDASTFMENPIEQFSPRASVSYAVSPKFSLNANIGRYFQLPGYTSIGYTEEGRFVNLDNGLRYIQADHAVAGIEYNTNFSSKITLEGYYKSYRYTPFLIEDQIALANLGGDFGVIGNERVSSTARGESYGLEFLYQQRLFKGFYGIASYTFGYSRFEDRNAQLIPSSWDSRHIANLAIGRRFKGNWEVGFNYRFQSGLPVTPFDPNSALVANWNINGRGLRDFSQLNTNRAGVFSELDLRVDKKIFFKNWSLDIYLDLRNVTLNSVPNFEMLLDRPLDENGFPIGGGIIENPEAPFFEQRYRVKEINTASGTILPTLGIVIEI